MPNYLSPGVYIQEVEPSVRSIEGVGTAIAAFVGLAAAGPFHAPTLVTNWTQFVNAFGEPFEGSYLAHAVYGYFLNGGGRAYIIRVGADTAEGQPAASADLPAAADAAAVAYRATALQQGEAGQGSPEITVEVTDPPEGSPEETFRVVIRGAGREEVFEPVTTRRGRHNVISQVNATSTLIRLAETAAPLADRRPANTRLTLAAPPSAEVALRPGDYIGDPTDRTGVGGLAAVSDVTMICVPDLMAAYQAGNISREGVKAVQAGLIAHCELMGDRVAILDPLPGLSPQQARDWRVDETAYDSRFAALYWPWVKVFDPVSGSPMLLPPSGHVAGVWARNDATRGVHKAPANEVIRGTIGVGTVITMGENDMLNPVGVNCIRSFPGRGIRIWGARTLCSDPAWRYINVRRLYNYVESSLMIGTQWVIFEPNDRGLWERLVRTIRAFLFRVWQDGALFGDTPDQAFYVKCDDETNPSEVIEAGQLVCEIGMAVVKPAEFVVFRLAQLPTGISAVNE
jgi:phage tail sheath protein FI